MSTHGPACKNVQSIQQILFVHSQGNFLHLDLLPCCAAHRIFKTHPFLSNVKMPWFDSLAESSCQITYHNQYQYHTHCYYNGKRYWLLLYQAWPLSFCNDNGRNLDVKNWSTSTTSCYLCNVPVTCWIGPLQCHHVIFLYQNHSKRKLKHPIVNKGLETTFPNSIIWNVTAMPRQLYWTQICIFSFHASVLNTNMHIFISCNAWVLGVIVSICVVKPYCLLWCDNSS